MQADHAAALRLGRHAPGVVAPGRRFGVEVLNMQKWKKNEIFEAIQAVGLDPKEFDLEDADGEVRIKHKWSTSCFTLGDDPSHYVGRYVVGDGPDRPFEAYSWQAIIPRISRWLGGVKGELETPDLWVELERDARLFFGATSDDLAANTPFTPEEQTEIAARLQTLAEHARRTYSLSAAQMQALDAKLDYLVNASRRLGRKDWQRLCWGRSLFTSSRHRFHRRPRVTCS
jgi:hypothetical protein